jgi:hypothetical protein
MKASHNAKKPTTHSFGSIAPIFRGPFLERVALGKHTSTLLELAAHFISFTPPSAHRPLAEWFDFFYGLLFEKYRCEYVYKNTIASKLFLSRHSPLDSYMTDELRSGESRADLAIINGTSTAYEIKSQYDSFDRLPGQLLDYKKVFDMTYVVTTPSKAAILPDFIGDEIGIIAMREHGSLQVVRKAQSNKHATDPSTIFDCMRRDEYCRAILDEFGRLPDVPNSQIYRACKLLFRSIPPGRAHDLMVKHLKRRGKAERFLDLINSAPPSLKHACISFSRSRALAVNITTRLGEPLL